MSPDHQAARLCAALALVCMGWGASCEARTDPDPEPPADAGQDACGAAQARLQKLSCLEGGGSLGRDGKPGTEDDRSFAELCRELAVDFPGLADARCIVEAVDCTAARECYQE